MSFSISLRTQALAFYETLIQTLPARTVSDRTCFRRVAAWLQDQIEGGHFGEEIFAQVLVLDRTATVERTSGGMSLIWP